MLDDTARDWRSAKIPKWVVEAADAEMLRWQITAALSWPTEPKPRSAPFHWGDYDRLTGNPVPGTYWAARSPYGGPYVEKVEIRARHDGDEVDVWKGKWMFRSSGSNWTANVIRGVLYATERDAWLALLWDECEAAARALLRIRQKM